MLCVTILANNDAKGKNGVRNAPAKQELVRLCRQRGISIAKLEREVGIGNGTIGKWGKSSPTVDSLKKVADHFGVSVDALLTGTPTE